jgi:hypothetical protein
MFRANIWTKNKVGRPGAALSMQGRQRKRVPDCAPALRNSAIIFGTRTQGRLIVGNAEVIPKTLRRFVLAGQKRASRR